MTYSQCCGSGTFIQDPDFFIVIYFFVATNFTKLENYFIFEMLKKKIWDSFQRIIELFTQICVPNLSKIWVWDPGYGKRPIPDPGSGSKGQKGTGSRIRIRNTAYRIAADFLNYKLF
jgi:hypothetical protein